MDLRDVGFDTGDWIVFAQMAGLCKGGIEPPGSLKSKQLTFIGEILYFFNTNQDLKFHDDKFITNQLAARASLR